MSFQLDETLLQDIKPDLNSTFCIEDCTGKLKVTETNSAAYFTFPEVNSNNAITVYDGKFNRRSSRFESEESLGILPDSILYDSTFDFKSFSPLDLIDITKVKKNDVFTFKESNNISNVKNIVNASTPLRHVPSKYKFVDGTIECQSDNQNSGNPLTSTLKSLDDFKKLYLAGEKRHIQSLCCLSETISPIQKTPQNVFNFDKTDIVSFEMSSLEVGDKTEKIPSVKNPLILSPIIENTMLENVFNSEKNDNLTFDLTLLETGNKNEMPTVKHPPNNLHSTCTVDDLELKTFVAKSPTYHREDTTNITKIVSKPTCSKDKDINIDHSKNIEQKVANDIDLNKTTVLPSIKNAELQKNVKISELGSFKNELAMKNEIDLNKTIVDDLNKNRKLQTKVENPELNNSENNRQTMEVDVDLKKTVTLTSEINVESKKNSSYIVSFENQNVMEPQISSTFQKQEKNNLPKNSRVTKIKGNCLKQNMGIKKSGITTFKPTQIKQNMGAKNLVPSTISITKQKSLEKAADSLQSMSSKISIGTLSKPKLTGSSRFVSKIKKPATSKTGFSKHDYKELKECSTLSPDKMDMNFKSASHIGISSCAFVQHRDVDTCKYPNLSEQKLPNEVGVTSVNVSLSKKTKIDTNLSSTRSICSQSNEMNPNSDKPIRVRPSSEKNLGLVPGRNVFYKECKNSKSLDIASKDKLCKITASKENKENKTIASHKNLLNGVSIKDIETDSKVMTSSKSFQEVKEDVSVENGSNSKKGEICSDSQPIKDESFVLRKARSDGPFKSIGKHENVKNQQNQLGKDLDGGKAGDVQISSRKSFGFQNGGIPNVKQTARNGSSKLPVRRLKQPQIVKL